MVKIQVKDFIKGDIVNVQLAINKKTKAEVLSVKNDTVKVKYIEKPIQNEFGTKAITYNISDVYPLNKEIRKVSTNNRIKPVKWVMPNKKRFISWINETFIQYRLTKNTHEKKTNGFELKSYQKFVRDYLQIDSPYRGILLYHGLGSGKTCTSIAVAENLINERNVIVLLPASLRQNYIDQLTGECGNFSYKQSPKLLKDRYTFISYNAFNALQQLKRLGSLDNHVIIVDEVHNLISMMISDSKQGPEIYNMLMNAKDVKIVFLSGTPIINIPFEASRLFNILRGHIEVNVFSIKRVGRQYGANWDLASFEKILLKTPYIDHVETNTVNRTMSVHLTIPNHHADFNQIIQEIVNIGQANDVILEMRYPKKYTLFPEDRDEFDKFFIDNSDPMEEKLKNNELFTRRMLGLVSYYRGASEKYYPRLNETQHIEVPMSDYQYAEYDMVRDIERSIEKSSAKHFAAKKKNKSAKKITSVFRAFSRQFSNFVFPENVERPFKSKLIAQAKKKRAGINVNDLENEANKAESALELSKKETQLIQEALEKLMEQSDVVFRRDLHIYSPKMKRMREIIDESPGLTLVYSTYRTLEGVEIFSRVLAEHGYEDFLDSHKTTKALRYAIWSGKEDEKNRADILKTFTSPDNSRGEYIKILLITAAGAEGLDLKNIRQVHIMEPFWHEIRIEQVIGRAIRLNSHIDLPEKDREVDVYRYFSVFSKDQAAKSKDSETTDEYIYDVALKKMTVVNDIKKIMKEAAVDCTLNALDNEKDLRCYSFPSTNEDSLASKPDIEQDSIYARTNSKKRNVEVSLKAMLMSKNGQIYVPHMKKKQFFAFNDKSFSEAKNIDLKTSKKVAVNPKTREVFDYNAAKTKNPIKIGDINNKGIVV